MWPWNRPPSNDDVAGLHLLLDRLQRAAHHSSPAARQAQGRALLRALATTRPTDPWTARWVADWLDQHMPDAQATAAELRAEAAAMATPGTAETVVLLADEDAGTALVAPLQVSLAQGPVDVWTPSRGLGELALAAADAAARVEPEPWEGVVRWEVHGLPARTRVDGSSLGLPLAAAIRAAARGRRMPEGWALTGKLRVGGQVEAVGALESKLEAALEAGFQNVIVPAANRVGLAPPAGIEVHHVSTLAEALALLFPRPPRRRAPLWAAAGVAAVGVVAALRPTPAPPDIDLVVVLLDEPVGPRTDEEDLRYFYEELPLKILDQRPRALFIDAVPPPAIPTAAGACPPCEIVDRLIPTLERARALRVPLFWGTTGTGPSPVAPCLRALGHTGEVTLQRPAGPFWAAAGPDPLTCLPPPGPLGFTGEADVTKPRADTHLTWARCGNYNATMPAAIARALQRRLPPDQWDDEVDCHPPAPIYLPPSADPCAQPFQLTSARAVGGFPTLPTALSCGDRPLDLRDKVVLLGDPRDRDWPPDQVRLGREARTLPGTTAIAILAWSMSAPGSQP